MESGAVSFCIVTNHPLCITYSKRQLEFSKTGQLFGAEEEGKKKYLLLGMP
jgi:hypothetical protein